MAKTKQVEARWTQETAPLYGLLTIDSINHEVQKLRTKFPEAEEFYIDYERGYDDSVELVITFQRHMTEEEIQEKERREARQRKLLEENERQQYLTLKKKFGD